MKFHNNIIQKCYYLHFRDEEIKDLCLMSLMLDLIKTSQAEGLMVSPCPRMD